MTEENKPNPVPIPPNPNAPNSQGAPTLTSLMSKKMTEEEQKQMLVDRNKVPVWILVMKYGSLVLLAAAIVGWIMVLVNMNEENKYLKIFNDQSENTKTAYKRTVSEKKTLDDQIASLSKDIGAKKSKLQRREYLFYPEHIDMIREGQMQWIDEYEQTYTDIKTNTINPDMTKEILNDIPDEEVTVEFVREPVYKYGLLNAVENMIDYFMSKEFSDKILSKKEDRVENILTIDSMSVNRSEASFSIEVSNLHEAVFFLGVEFIGKINSYPFFQGGEIKSFVRKKGRDSDTTMNFSAKVPIQPTNIELKKKLQIAEDRLLEKEKAKEITQLVKNYWTAKESKDGQSEMASLELDINNNRKAYEQEKIYLDKFIKALDAKRAEEEKAAEIEDLKNRIEDAVSDNKREELKNEIKKVQRSIDDEKIKLIKEKTETLTRRLNIANSLYALADLNAKKTQSNLDSVISEIDSVKQEIASINSQLERIEDEADAGFSEFNTWKLKKLAEDNEALPPKSGVKPKPKVTVEEKEDIMEEESVVSEAIISEEIPEAESDSSGDFPF